MKDKTIIVAGDYKQFLDFVQEKRWALRDCKHITRADQLLGVAPRTSFYVTGNFPRSSTDYQIVDEVNARGLVWR